MENTATMITAALVTTPALWLIPAMTAPSLPHRGDGTRGRGW